MFSCPLIRFSGVYYEKLLRHEKIIFLVFLFISLLQLWLTRYIPSLDGPQHLYNANVLVELLRGNELFQSFFKVNDVIVGYWSGHFALAFFKFFFPAWLAEKLFLTSYVLGMIFSFRYLVRSLNPSKGNFVAYLIFPFVYHSYLLMGYYTFSIAAIFFFLAFGYWIRHKDELSFQRIIVFALILLALFLSHGLVYVLFAFAFGLYLVVTFIGSLIQEKNSFSIAHWFRRIWKSALSFTPSFILWVLYIRSVMSINSTVSEPSYSFAELVKFLLRIRQLVGFHHEMESVAYIALAVLLFILLIAFLVLFLPALKDKSARLSDLLSERNAWIWISMGFLGLYLFAPDRISAGSLTHRFGLFFFFGLIVWLSFQRFPKTIQLISLLVIFLSMSYTRFLHQRFYHNLNKDIAALEELQEFMEPNSVVTYQQASHNWTHKHFQLYAASDKPLVHLKNPQCQGQFPVVWNVDALPRCYAGERLLTPSGAPKAGKDHSRIELDYVTVFYKEQYFKDSTNADWWQVLDEYYEEVYSSKDGRAALYGLKK